MIGKLLKTLHLRSKVAPNSTLADGEEFQWESGPKRAETRRAARSHRHTVMKTSSLPTIIEEISDPFEPIKFQNWIKSSDQPNRSSFGTTASSASASSDGGEDEESRQTAKQLSFACELLGGIDEDLDAVLLGFEQMEEAVWLSVIQDQQSLSPNTVLRYSTLDPSSIPPPNTKVPSSVQPVENLLRIMIHTKGYEERLKLKPEADKVLAEALERLEGFEGNENVRSFLQGALQNLANKESTTHTFDGEIINRISSVIRFYLRLALNPMNGFSPIVLANTRANRENHSDMQPQDLNVAAMLHNALSIVAAGPRLDVVNAGTRYKSARKFIESVLACAKRIEAVDEKRKRSWLHAQRWASQVQTLFHEELRDLALLGNLTELSIRLSEDGKALDRTLLDEQLNSSTKKRNTPNLRSSRVKATAMGNMDGFFPDVVFILDADR